MCTEVGMAMRGEEMDWCGCYDRVDKPKRDVLLHN